MVNPSDNKAASDKRFIIGVFAFFIVLGCIAGILVSRHNATMSSNAAIGQPGQNSAVTTVPGTTQSWYTNRNEGPNGSSQHSRIIAVRPLPAYLNPGNANSQTILDNPPPRVVNPQQ